MAVIAGQHLGAYTPSSSYAREKFPNYIVYGVIAISLTPFLLQLLGVDLGTQSQFASLAANTESVSATDEAFYRLTGSFTHTLLEWSAVCVAAFTAVLAFSRFSMTGDITTPIIGVALFFSGCMDAFHTLAADRLIEAVADNTNLVPFTWAVCRIFNAVIMIAGLALILQGKSILYKGGIRVVIIVSLLCAVISYVIIHYLASSEQLPQTQFSDSIVTRPYDAVPLLLFIFAGIYLYPKYRKMHPSIFAHALVLSAIPEVVVEIHMTFGSSALFDSHFNAAHFLKVVAYIVPMLGLIYDYVATYESQQRNYEDLEQRRKELLHQREALSLANSKLDASNQELEKFAYVASHDLQEPLRKVQAFGDMLVKNYSDSLDEKAKDYLRRMQNASKRMNTLINDLLTFSRLSTEKLEKQPIDLNKIVSHTLSDLQIKIEETGAQFNIGNLPTIRADATQTRRLFQNLISNAIKFQKEGQQPLIRISSTEITVTRNNKRLKFNRIEVSDNGIGFDEIYKVKIFEVFQRLHGINEYEGTGIGLAICKRIVEQQDGYLDVNSTPGDGTSFYIELPLIN